MARVAVLGSLPESLINFRGPLLAEMVKAGHEVHALSPPADVELVTQLTDMGVQHHMVPMARTGLNPLQDLRSFLFLRRLFRRLKPDCLLAYTIKPVIYGCLAARAAGVPHCHAMIEGLGYTFAGKGLRAGILGGVARILYKRALRGAERVFFLNPDNLSVFVDLGLLRDPEQARLIDGIGVDLEKFSPTALPSTPSFLMIARLLRDKGVYEYVEAARQIKARYPAVRFRLVGWIDDNPDAIARSELDEWVAEGVVDYLGLMDDVRPAITDCSVYVLPSYHEGMPRTVLEAMAMGRPVITSDAPGCRETVVEGENGFLVKPGDSGSLAQAMQRFIDQPDLIPVFGSASRQAAERRFDERRINGIIMHTMGLSA